MAGRGLHKEIRKATAEAEHAGLRVVTFSGHTWGQVECPCGQHIKIYSTGRNPEFGAKLIHGSSAGTASMGARHDLRVHPGAGPRAHRRRGGNPGRGRAGPGRR